MTKVAKLVLWLLKQVGKAYRLGSEVRLDPDAFGNLYAFADQQAWDCSELVQAGLWAAGVSSVGGLPLERFDGAGVQYCHCRPLPVQTARETSQPGLLVFIQSASAYPDKPMRIGHVGIVIAKNAIVEARGERFGVVVGPVRPSFNLAGKVDELYR